MTDSLSSCCYLYIAVSNTIFNGGCRFKNHVGYLVPSVYLSIIKKIKLFDSKMLMQT